MCLLPSLPKKTVSLHPSPFLPPSRPSSPVCDRPQPTGPQQCSLVGVILGRLTRSQPLLTPRLCLSVYALLLRRLGAHTRQHALLLLLVLLLRAATLLLLLLLFLRLLRLLLLLLCELRCGGLVLACCCLLFCLE